MSFPVLNILWHCATAGLELTASHQWSEARTLAASYQIDIDRALDPFPVVPVAENFMSQPFLQACLFDEYYSGDLAMMQATVKAHEQELKANLAVMESGRPTRFKPILAEIGPEGLPENKGKKSPAELLVGFTDELGIPWDELLQAARLPQSQLPPLGSIPPTDDHTPPLVTMVPTSNLSSLQLFANLRTHALLGMKKPEDAKDCLLIQSRLAEAWLNLSTWAGASLGMASVQSLISQIHSGFENQQWRDKEIQWFADWAGKLDMTAILQEATRMECRYAIRFSEGVKADPGIPARAARFLRSDPAFYEVLGYEAWEDLIAQASLPFGQEWLADFSEYSELLYGLAPPAVFTLWAAADTKELCENHLSLLKNGGLAAYAWPTVEKRKSTVSLNYSDMGALFASTQSQLNLLRTACALDQWRATHGDFPKSLQELQPGLPEAACLDTCSGKPLRYQRVSPKKYRLYSVGKDRKDDGGKPLVENKGDIVWK